MPLWMSVRGLGSCGSHPRKALSDASRSDFGEPMYTVLMQFQEDFMRLTDKPFMSEILGRCSVKQ
jgi:hypothetical protein